jgi:6-hydroxycyclohex-1-ene-1-carbonyl-CoA dehydrogenase
MKAAIFREPKKPLSIEDVPVPEITDDEILVKVVACGVCHTDLHYIDHGVPTFRKPPIILGHEISGVVEGVGKNAEKKFKVGDKVLLPPVLTCGVCFQCREGRENICDNMLMFGNHIDGGFAEYVKCPAKDAVVLPQQMPFGLDEACVISDAVSTPYHAVVHRAKVKAGDRVAVFGCGGVGLNAIQFLKLVGAYTIAVDIDSRKLELAKSFGADELLDASKDSQPHKTIRRMTNGGVDIAFEVVGRPEVIATSFEALRKGGRLCVVGYSAESSKLNAAKLMFFEMEITGSLGCRPIDYPKIVQLAASGQIKVKPLVTSKLPLQQVNQALDNLRKGIGIRNIVVVS